jgi:hypothetical protein
LSPDFGWRCLRKSHVRAEAAERQRFVKKLKLRFALLGFLRKNLVEF